MKVKASTIIRTAVLSLTLLNTVLTGMGKNPLPWSEDEIYSGVSAAVTAFAAIWTWWKNNSFTQAAIRADEYKDELKRGE